MAYVDIVTALALLQYLTFGFKVGRARGRYAVKAPAGSTKIPWSSWWYFCPACISSVITLSPEWPQYSA